MALIRLDHFSESIKVNLPLDIILPDPGQMDGIPVRDRKVLYLLHGLGDDGSAWQRYTSIETAAEEYGLVVVMPSAGRSFYSDQRNGQLYFTYLMEELPQYLSDVFNITPGRENTLIAGNSMGGYGAFKAAFLHPERFYAAASFSGALSLEILSVRPNDARKNEFSYVFGDLSQLKGSENDPATWLMRAAKNPTALPHLYLSCGRQDDLYGLNVQVRDACLRFGIPLEYYEEDAAHEWAFWDSEIRHFLALALED
jgi:putative tributyrin esterase